MLNSLRTLTLLTVAVLTVAGVGLASAADFVEPGVDPSVYVDRYINEEAFTEWYDTFYPGVPLYESLGITESEYEDIADALMQSVCGPGTTLVGNECVSDAGNGSTSSDYRGQQYGTELGIAAAAAFISWRPPWLWASGSRGSCEAATETGMPSPL